MTKLEKLGLVVMILGMFGSALCVYGYVSGGYIPTPINFTGSIVEIFMGALIFIVSGDKK